MPRQQRVSRGFEKSHPPCHTVLLAGVCFPVSCINSAAGAQEMLVCSEGDSAAITGPVLAPAPLLGMGWDGIAPRSPVPGPSPSSAAGAGHSHGAGASSPPAHGFMHCGGPYPRALACSIPALPRCMHGCW